MDNYLSKKIKFTSFISMLLVLFIHGFNSTLYPDELLSKSLWVFEIQNFISFHVCRIAVPFFFIVSGFLFAFNFNYTFSSYTQKLRSRIKTLLFPYLIWVFIWTSLFFLLSQISFFKAYVNNPIQLNSFSWLDLVAVFKKPICYQFWFIKDLMFLVLIVPFLYFFLKRTFIIMPLLGYLNLVYWEIDLFIFYNLSLFYFTLGLFLAIHYREISKIKVKLHFSIIGIIWLLLYFANQIDFVKYLIPLIILIGILFFWKMYDAFNQESTSYKALQKWASYSFFLFAIHEPIVISFKKIGFAFLGKTPVVSLFLYFILPIFVFSIGIGIGIYTKKWFPNFFKLITGGR